MRQNDQMSYDFEAFETFWRAYWEKRPSNHQHPSDTPFFLQTEPRGMCARPAAFDFAYHPCPFDGPLKTAKVIVCLANPKYSGLTGTVDQQNKIIERMKDGRKNLPEEWFDDCYQSIFKKFPQQILRNHLWNHLAIFNVCAYASENMKTPEINHAAGLKSTWEAQKLLRELLLPKAENDELYLIFLRKHMLWGVTEGYNASGNSNIEVIRGHEVDGMVPENTVTRVLSWLARKGLSGIEL